MAGKHQTPPLLSPHHPYLLTSMCSYPSVPGIPRNVLPLLILGAWGNIQFPKMKTTGPPSASTFLNLHIKKMWSLPWEVNGATEREGQWRSWAVSTYSQDVKLQECRILGWEIQGELLRLNITLVITNGKALNSISQLYSV